MIYVGSLKYSPVYKSHCCAFGKACEKAGYSVKYLFSKEYAWMLPPEIMEKTVFVGHSNSIFSMVKDTVNPRNLMTIHNALKKDRPTHIYLHNYHFFNHFISHFSKKINCKFIYHSHEPYVENKSAHGSIQRYWLYLSEYMGRRLIRNVAVAIVSSDEAARLFDKAYPSFGGKKIKIPLIYEDLYKNISSQNRQFVTFVGPPVPAKGPEIFLSIINSSKGSLKFLLISNKKITEKKFLNLTNLRVFDKSHISDEEYNQLIKESFVVITPYKRETQSSVILTSYMSGTPVVSSNVGGLPEFVKNGKTGYLLPISASPEDWLERINQVRTNFPSMSANCRQYFENNFSENNWGKYLKDLLS